MLSTANYYSTAELKEKYPTLFKTSYTKKKIIEKYGIPEKKCKYFYTNNGSIIESNPLYSKAVLYILKTYVDKNLLKKCAPINKNVSVTPKEKTTTISNKKNISHIANQSNNISTITVPSVASGENSNKNTNDSNTKYSSMTYPLIKLNEKEKFEINGKKHNITVRGKKTKNEILFDMYDIEKMLGIDKLAKKINASKRYTVNIDYKMVYVSKKKNNVKEHTCVPYFTYTGLIKYIFNSKNEYAVHLQDWVSNILYVSQFGSAKERKELSDKILGISAIHAREMLNSTTKIPCVYLFTLGYVKDLRESMKISENIDDNNIVCKYGYTCDLDRRTYEHNSAYGKIKGASVMLKYYQYINQEYLNNAENTLNSYFNDIKVKFTYENAKEIIIVSKDMLNNSIKAQYENIGNTYSMSCDLLVTKLKEADMKVKLIETEKKLETAELLIKIKDLEYANTILRLKLESMNQEKNN